MKAVIASAQFGEPKVVTDRPRPKLRPTYILVRTVAVAANPADALYLSFGLAGAGSLLGNDYAGVVVEVGSDVIRDFKVGDRVCGCTRGGDAEILENGTAAEYVVVKADLQIKIPERMSFEDASTTGVTFLTTGRCLYRSFDIPFPDGNASSKDRGYILIYGGSSAMGTATIQFAKLSGFTVITTASPHNFDLCKSFGADHVLDYHDPEAPVKVKELADNSLKFAIDCISGPNAPVGATFCAATLARGGKYSVLAPFVSPGREDVENFATVGYSFLGEEWSMMGQKHPASKEDLEFSMRFAEVAEQLLAEGKLRPHPVELREGGLDAFPQAVEDLKNGTVSGKKLVMRV